MDTTNKPKVTAKDFFLWAGAMVAFYWSIVAYVFLVLDYIDYAFPNPLAYYPSDPYQSGISYEMASIIVLLPTFLLLMRVIRADMARDPSRTDIWVRRWALILTLFVAGAAMAGDLIALLTAFLSGEALSTAFLLKVLVIFLVAAGVFLHFVADLKGYWSAYPSRKRMVALGVAVLAIATIIAGFFIVGTPREARLQRFDDQKIGDLQNIQSQVVYYWQAKRALPKTLADLNNSLSYGPVPVDAQTGQPYAYEATGALSFKLCAMFNGESHEDRNRFSEARPMMPIPTDDAGVIKGMMQDNWRHGAGETCFDRSIDPSFYPPMNPKF